jgi:hypothetical protein
MGRGSHRCPNGTTWERSEFPAGNPGDISVGASSIIVVDYLESGEPALWVSPVPETL